MDEIVDSDVAALTSAHRGGPLLASLPGAGDLTMAAAYDVQTKLVAGLGAPIVGWKLAHSTTKAQQAKGLSEPTVGRLLKGMIRAPGLSLGSAEINAPEVEPEICVVLARDLPPGGAPYSVDAVRTAVGATHFAMEVASNRYRVKADQPLPAVIADNNGAHSLILGDVIAPDDFAAVSTAAISVTLGDGTNVPGFAPEDRPRHTRDYSLSCQLPRRPW